MIDLPPDRIAEYRAFLDTLAEAARAEILPRFRADVGVDDKLGAGRGFDPVTDADREAERAMRALIATHYRDHGVIGEEFDDTASESGFSFILDPVDGTRAFIAGLPLWGTLIGLAYHGKPLMGVLDQGYLDERFVGFPGGAVLQAHGAVRALRVRPCGDLREAILATTDPTLFNPAELGGFTMVRDTARLTRYGCDCYAYGMIAAGGVDMVIESGLRVWDVAALIPIVRGAGGVFTNWRGGPAALGGQVIAASDQRLIDQALVALKRCADPGSPGS
jgi:histidinol phosphatase-like enzyme (inositol monophosphatase family)